SLRSESATRTVQPGHGPGHGHLPGNTRTRRMRYQGPEQRSRERAERQNPTRIRVRTPCCFAPYHSRREPKHDDRGDDSRRVEGRTRPGEQREGPQLVANRPISEMRNGAFLTPGTGSEEEARVRVDVRTPRPRSRTPPMVRCFGAAFG